MAIIRAHIDRLLAIPMFGLTLLWLLFAAGLLHVPDEPGNVRVLTVCQWGMILTWSMLLGELVLHACLRSPQWQQHLAICLLPPLRLGARDHADGTTVWLPVLGWCEINRDLRARVEKALSIPMIVIALMVLPLMAIEHSMPEQQAATTDAEETTDATTSPPPQPRPSLKAMAVQHPEWLIFGIQAATGLIWLAFTAEFMVMISIVDHRLRYCKEHWIDIAVICLPLIAFLRVARLGRLLRLQQLSRTARMYRLRGLLMRAYRAVLVLDVLDRVMRQPPAVRLARLRETLEEKQIEIDKLQESIRQIEAELAAAKGSQAEPPSEMRRAA